MSQTPYDPASAPAAAPAHTSPGKPLAVTWAVRCLWTSAALTLLQGVPLIEALPRAAVGTTVLSLVVTTGLLLLVATMVNGGRSWARGLFALVYLLGASMLFSTLALRPQAFQSLPPLLQVLECVQFVLQTSALVFMFTPSARQWFRQIKPTGEELPRAHH